MDANDDKIHILPDRISTLPLGHYIIAERQSRWVIIMPLSFDDWDNKLEQTIQYRDLLLGSYCIINEREIKTKDKRNALILTLISSNMKIYYVFAPNQIRNRIILHKPK